MLGNTRKVIITRLQIDQFLFLAFVSSSPPPTRDSLRFTYITARFYHRLFASRVIVKTLNRVSFNRESMESIVSWNELEPCNLSISKRMQGTRSVLDSL